MQICFCFVSAAGEQKWRSVQSLSISACHSGVYEIWWFFAGQVSDRLQTCLVSRCISTCCIYCYCHRSLVCSGLYYPRQISCQRGYGIQSCLFVCLFVL